ncbi:hypothetical protein [Qipengyuania vesicularis]|uniref:hypothetical protein n=1 Tax=Qipengyuania vesicularis TaxID=2867232 RepID=UPI001C87A64B|nr:hypothetical protein [Qipengyuania vesicularis]MBX7528024.1 hypothetical protein [Qipengyuania vesicularis]
MNSLRAGTAYWAMVFALGFVLGTVRVLWGAEAIGETAFILIELPVMLAASTLAARWLLRRFAIDTAGEALAMGALAFALLILAELALATGLSGMTAREWLMEAWQVPGIYGTLGQILFGLIPSLLIVARRATR